MRRKDREVTDFGKIVKIIDECDIVRLGVQDGDFPYIVPLNFGYKVDDGKIYLYFHGAMAGRKYELLNVQPYCSFEMDLPLKLELNEEKTDATQRYKSVMGKARATLLTGSEKEEAFVQFVLGRYEETRDLNYSKEKFAKTAIFKLEVLLVTGKANI